MAKCRFCGTEILIEGTTMCDNCFEVERRILCMRIEVLKSILDFCGFYVDEFDGLVKG